MSAHIILASESPRRRELLGLSGYPFNVVASAVDESSVSHPDPVQDCIATARLKAEAARGQLPPIREGQTFILAADTIVAVDGQVLGKPADDSAAKDMLLTLRGRVHQVHTGVAIIELDSAREVGGAHSAMVTMRSYSDAEMMRYIASGDPLDKAGAYAIQHPTFRPVEELHGCYLGVMGLSVCHVLDLLETWHLTFRADLEQLERAHRGYPCSLYDKIAQKHGK